MRAALIPLRVEHEVVDDELASGSEQVGECDLTARCIEHVRRFHLHPGQFAPLTAEVVATSGEFLLRGEQRGSLAEPLLTRDHAVLLDAVLIPAAHQLTSNSGHARGEHTAFNPEAHNSTPDGIQSTRARPKLWGARPSSAPAVARDALPWAGVGRRGIPGIAIVEGSRHQARSGAGGRRPGGARHRGSNAQVAPRSTAAGERRGLDRRAAPALDIQARYD